MSLRFPLLMLLAALLTACLDSALSLNLQLDAYSGLVTGDPVVARDQAVGTVTAVDALPNGGSVAHLQIDSDFRALATTGARFRIVANPDTPGRKRVEILPGPAEAPLLADQATVQGSVPAEILSPFTDMMRGLTEGLGVFRDQVEQFRSEMQRLPNSEEARRLQEQWQQLQREMQQAQAATEEALKKDVIPRLQRQMEDLEKKLKELEKLPAPTPTPPARGGKSTPVF